MNFWGGVDRTTIVQEFLDNIEVDATQGRPAADYHYQTKLPPFQKAEIRIVGDKIWNPATLMLHGNHSQILSLEKRLGVPLRIIHAIRNPLDTIATTRSRSDAPVSNHIRWYFMHCKATEALRERLPSDLYLDSHHEDLLRDPGQEISRLCQFLGVQTVEDHIAAASAELFTSARKTRDSIAWSQAALRHCKLESHAIPFWPAMPPAWSAPAAMADGLSLPPQPVDRSSPSTTAAGCR